MLDENIQTFINFADKFISGGVTILLNSRQIFVLKNIQLLVH